jgi:hypothetical protein
VGKVLSNPQFKDDFIVNRSNGSWQGGDFVQSAPTVLNYTGAVVPADYKTLIQVPEGDRTSEIMTFLSTQPLYVTHAGEQETDGTSDVITWNGHNYRLYQVKNWSSYGFYKAIGISVEGE